MARIELEPGEVFEHRHDSPSTTMLVAGVVDFTLDGKTRRLVPGEQVTVPANKSHSSANGGSAVAVIVCAHPNTPTPTVAGAR